MKKALLVGINAYPSAPLRGCLNDVEDWHSLLTTVGGFNADNVRAVCDARADTEGIRGRMDWLKEGISGPGDEVFFAYSGHGSQVRDRGPQDELADHMDEILCPYDLDWNMKVITDDDIGAWLKGFPPGVKITVVLDCCHSGTGTRELRPPIENPHYKADRYLHPPIDIALRADGMTKLKGVKLGPKIGMGRGWRKNNWRSSRAAPPRRFSWWSWLCHRCKPKPKPKPPEPKPQEKPSVNHVLISGCRSDQTSADAFIDGRYNGALSRFLINAIKDSPKASVRIVQQTAREAILKAGYSQESQLEGPDTLLNLPIFMGK